MTRPYQASNSLRQDQNLVLALKKVKDNFLGEGKFSKVPLNTIGLQV
jgi:hypothetical protein